MSSSFEKRETFVQHISQPEDEDNLGLSTRTYISFKSYHNENRKEEDSEEDKKDDDLDPINEAEAL